MVVGSGKTATIKADSVINFELVAEHLHTTMCNAGVFDDYDELIGDALDSSFENALAYHLRTLESVKFLNTYSPTYKTNPLDPNVWNQTFNHVCDLVEE